MFSIMKMRKKKLGGRPRVLVTLLKYVFFSLIVFGGSIETEDIKPVAPAAVLFVWSDCARRHTTSLPDMDGSLFVSLKVTALQHFLPLFQNLLTGAVWICRVHLEVLTIFTTIVKLCAVTECVWISKFLSCSKNIIIGPSGVFSPLYLEVRFVSWFCWDLQTKPQMIIHYLMWLIHWPGILYNSFFPFVFCFFCWKLYLNWKLAHQIGYTVYSTFKSHLFCLLTSEYMVKISLVLNYTYTYCLPLYCSTKALVKTSRDIPWDAAMKTMC